MTRIHCGCSVADDGTLIPVCTAHLCEQRPGRDYEPQWVGNTLLVGKATTTHTDLVAAFVCAAIEKAEPFQIAIVKDAA